MLDRWRQKQEGWVRDWEKGGWSTIQYLTEFLADKQPRSVGDLERRKERRSLEAGFGN